MYILSTASDVVSTLHKTTDFSGSQFVVLVLSSLDKLWLLNYTDNRGAPPSFGAMTTLVATQVVPLEGQPMMVLLEPGGGLSLYSGTYKVRRYSFHRIYKFMCFIQILLKIHKINNTHNIIIMGKGTIIHILFPIPR